MHKIEIKYHKNNSWTTWNSSNIGKEKHSSDSNIQAHKVIKNRHISNQRVTERNYVFKKCFKHQN